MGQVFPNFMQQPAQPAMFNNQQQQAYDLFSSMFKFMMQNGMAGSSQCFGVNQSQVIPQQQPIFSNQKPNSMIEQRITNQMKDINQFYTEQSEGNQQ